MLKKVGGQLTPLTPRIAAFTKRCFQCYNAGWSKKQTVFTIGLTNKRR